MKIHSWIKKNVPSFKRGAWINKIPDELYVIGMCWECKYMEDEFETCVNEKSFNYGKAVRDGCIYFKKKNV